MFLRKKWQHPKQLFGTRAKNALVPYLADKIRPLVGEKAEQVVLTLLEDCFVQHRWSLFRDADGNIHDEMNPKSDPVEPTYPVEGFVITTAIYDRRDLLHED